MYIMNQTNQVVLKISELENLYRSVYELWVFGYGSILWKPGFTYKCREVGVVQGVVRRFWQGNVTHRGTPELPGRVATLIDDDQGHVWGMAFQLVGRTMIKKALRHLGARECSLGGYQATVVPFEGHDVDGRTTRHNVLMFRAVPDNPYYMGPAPVDDMAHQILACMGRTGHNVQYVTRLADFIRKYIPQDEDSHLFDLDQKLRAILEKNQTWLKDVLKSVRKKEARHYRSIIISQRNSINNEESLSKSESEGTQTL